MGFVKQRNGSDCAIAAIANATGSTYKYVRSLYPGRIQGGIYDHEIRWIMYKYFPNFKYVKSRSPLKELKEWVKKHGRGNYVVILTGRLCDESAHAVAVIDGEIVGDYYNSSEVYYYFKE